MHTKSYNRCQFLRGGSREKELRSEDDACVPGVVGGPPSTTAHSRRLTAGAGHDVCQSAEDPNRYYYYYYIREKKTYTVYPPQIFYENFFLIFQPERGSDNKNFFLIFFRPSSSVKNNHFEKKNYVLSQGIFYVKIKKLFFQDFFKIFVFIVSRL